MGLAKAHMIAHFKGPTQTRPEARKIMAEPTQFKTIPSHDQLQAMERDLRFHPSTVTQPAALSRAQVESYNRDGYIRGIPIFDDDEVLAQRQFFDQLLDQVIAAGANSYSIQSAHMKYGKVYDTLTHPRIVACVKDLLGDEVVGLAAHYFCKLPGDPKVVSWHQDASYWPITPSKTVTVWLAIDDSDRQNACMRFVSGSHHLGHLTYRLSEEDENNVLSQTVDHAEQLGAEIDVELRAGQISMHSDLLLHSSRANTSQRRRCGLTLRYCTPEVRALPGFGWAEEGIVISGQDPAGHWGNPSRPERDFVITSKTPDPLAVHSARAK
jgi:non-heme Fe2+,alpha-ketoglutarate-dependent halogenase